MWSMILELIGARKPVAEVCPPGGMGRSPPHHEKDRNLAAVAVDQTDGKVMLGRLGAGGIEADGVGVPDARPRTVPKPAGEGSGRLRYFRRVSFIERRTAG